MNINKEQLTKLLKEAFIAGHNGHLDHKTFILEGILNKFKEENGYKQVESLFLKE